MVVKVLGWVDAKELEFGAEGRYFDQAPHVPAGTDRQNHVWNLNAQYLGVLLFKDFDRRLFDAETC